MEKRLVKQGRVDEFNSQFKNTYRRSGCLQEAVEGGAEGVEGVTTRTSIQEVIFILIK
jgi:hypothetical protein